MNEKYIVAGLKGKDKNVFNFVFSYNYSGLCTYARGWVNDPDVAEDLGQDFFVRLWTDSSKIEITSSLKSYFFTSVKNRAVNHLKHVKIKKMFGKNATVTLASGKEVNFLLNNGNILIGNFGIGIG